MFFRRAQLIIEVTRIWSTRARWRAKPEKGGLDLTRLQPDAQKERLLNDASKE
jgi:hypothetical protein